MNNQVIEIKKNINKLEPKFAELGVQKETFLKEASFAVQAVAKNPTLRNCQPGTLEAAVYNLALTGLTLNPVLQYAYLVPRKLNKKDKYPVCVLDISYRGLIKIAIDSGGIKSVRGVSVYKNDFFEAEEGTNPFINHKPLHFGDRGEIIGCYCVATLPDGSKTHLIMNKAEIEKVRATSKMPDSGPWKDWWEEMGIKTVIKRARKLWPHSEKLAKAVDILNQHEGLAELVNNAPQLKPEVNIPLAISQVSDISEPEEGEDNNGDTKKEEGNKDDPWGFGTSDPEARINKKHKLLIESHLIKAGIEKEQFFNDFKLEDSLGGIMDLRNKNLSKVRDYIENA